MCDAWACSLVSAPAAHVSTYCRRLVAVSGRAPSLCPLASATQVTTIMYSSGRVSGTLVLDNCIDTRCVCWMYMLCISYATCVKT